MLPIHKNFEYREVYKDAVQPDQDRYVTSILLLTMSTATLGVEPHHSSLMFYPHNHASQPSPRPATSSLIHRTGLPSPPGSTRTSIETPSKAPSGSVHSSPPHNKAITSQPIPTLPSPPQSQVGSPPKTNSIDNILLQLLPFFERGDGECEINGVTATLLDDLKVYMFESDQAGIWERLR